MKKLVVVLALVSSCYAQGTVAWTNPSQTPPWPASNGGFLSLTNSYDSLSNTWVVYGQSFLQGTLSVTNGSPTATWISGDKFSVLWHFPNTINVNSGTVMTMASASVPTNCAVGIPVS